MANLFDNIIQDIFTILLSDLEFKSEIQINEYTLCVCAENACER